MESAGQLVIEAAHDVTVYKDVAYTVRISYVLLGDETTASALCVIEALSFDAPATRALVI